MKKVNQMKQVRRTLSTEMAVSVIRNKLDKNKITFNKSIHNVLLENRRATTSKSKKHGGVRCRGNRSKFGVIPCETRQSGRVFYSASELSIFVEDNLIPALEGKLTLVQLESLELD